MGVQSRIKGLNKNNKIWAGGTVWSTATGFRPVWVRPHREFEFLPARWTRRLMVNHVAAQLWNAGSIPAVSTTFLLELLKREKIILHTEIDDLEPFSNNSDTLYYILLFYLNAQNFPNLINYSCNLYIDNTMKQI